MHSCESCCLQLNNDSLQISLTKTADASALLAWMIARGIDRFGADSNADVDYLVLQSAVAVERSSFLPRQHCIMI